MFYVISIGKYSVMMYLLQFYAWSAHIHQHAPESKANGPIHEFQIVVLVLQLMPIAQIEYDGKVSSLLGTEWAMAYTMYWIFKDINFMQK